MNFSTDVKAAGMSNRGLLCVELSMCEGLPTTFELQSYWMILYLMLFRNQGTGKAEFEWKRYQMKASDREVVVSKIACNTWKS